MAGLHLFPIAGIPLIHPGDDLGSIFIVALQENKFELKNQDILVVAQKVISKAEGRLVNLSEVEPSDRAIEISRKVNKDPRFVELVLSESNEILRCRPDTLIVEHKNGFICANAGIDHSNVKGPWGRAEDWVLLLPLDADASANMIRNQIQKAMNAVNIGVLIIDSHGRAWRNGTVGAAIGMAGIPGLVDLRGTPDLFGYHLKITQVAAADELAAAASLVMGQAAEAFPLVLVRGFPYELRDGSLKELIREHDKDLFR